MRFSKKNSITKTETMCTSQTEIASGYRRIWIQALLFFGHVRTKKSVHFSETKINFTPPQTRHQIYIGLQSNWVLSSKLRRQSHSTHFGTIRFHIIFYLSIALKNCFLSIFTLLIDVSNQILCFLLVLENCKRMRSTQIEAHVVQKSKRGR